MTSCRNLAAVAGKFTAAGIEVCEAPICRVQDEFRRAVQDFEQQDVDMIVSLHLAYSPSLEAADVLSGTPLPLLILDTTMDADFGPQVDPARIMYNHGVHGVQDFANLLLRRGKAFRIVAGHVDEPELFVRAAAAARGAFAAHLLHRAKALRIGHAFQGMADFAVDPEVLERVLGIVAHEIAPAELAAAVKGVKDAQVKAEMAADQKAFKASLDAAVHERSVRLGLGLRQYLERGGYTAFSANFQAFDKADGPICTVPFLEASKAMARGIGYAGEGDVLTASLAGALIRAFGRATFTEIFCPDWRGNTLFLSHMGEINPAVVAGKPLLLEKDYPFSPAQNPAFITGAPAPGPGVLVNLAPLADDAFRLLLAPVEVLADSKSRKLAQCVRGWIRPACGSTAEFLENYSIYGGTHHSVLVLGEHTEGLAAFAEFANLECCVI